MMETISSGGSGGSFDRLPDVQGKATDIGVGADGTAWVVGRNPALGGFGVFRWNGNDLGEEVAGAAARGIAGGLFPDPWQGVVWVVNSDQGIFRGLDQDAIGSPFGSGGAGGGDWT
jgi:hypothetical protein